MPVWMPEARVYIGGVEYTGDTLADVKITFGRTDITQSIRPAVATFNILSDGAGLGIDINDDVIITFEKSATTETIFTGTISDFNIKVLESDYLEYQFTSVSPMAILARTNVGASGYPAEKQGERISNIIRDGSGTLTWAQTTITWAAATYPWNDGGLQIADIDDGWDFGIYTASEINSMTAIQKASLFGFLFENPDGTISFKDFFSRTGSSGYTVIDADETIRNTIKSELTTGQIINNATLNDFAGNQYSEINTNSIIDYGQRTASFDTFMSNAFDINVVLDNFVGDYSVPRQFISGFTFPLSTMDTATRDALISVRGNQRWQINGLPTAFGGNYKGIVEGWTWSINKGDAFISLYLSDWQLNQVFIPTP